jgi:hypothetical protein
MRPQLSLLSRHVALDTEEVEVAEAPDSEGEQHEHA